MRRRASVHGHCSAGFDAHDSALIGAKAAHLDIGGDADAYQGIRILGAKLCLLLAQGLIAGKFKRGHQIALIIAGVIGRSSWRFVGKLRWFEIVAAAHFNRIDPQFGGDQFNCPLNIVDGFGAPGAAVSSYGDGVGEDAAGFEIDGRV